MLSKLSFIEWGVLRTTNHLAVLGVGYSADWDKLDQIVFMFSAGERTVSVTVVNRICACKK